ncbi:DUF3060 domain-containing protein [Frondihabitans sp. VKM Ac-2883]|uniref:DUF3060 domain-containing protein n=1 Tax=Frondihabitans sp. VKM Ac-2883 TaxID=2783823 RepID=UPI00188B7DA4|nr:DUF3060 domain-containing protein [Frondihabitans sp. VKM Ac-2883]MBF4575769.1 DUF3060 domain-containing protein [Frondihabitans sp. VKM Ac-2883]
MTKTPILLATLAICVTAGLTGCTASATTSDGTPEPTTSSTKPAAATSDRYNDKCVEGIAHINVDKTKKKTLKGDCDTVWILGDGGTVDLDNVKSIGILGKGNTIDVTSVNTIDATGDNNTINHRGPSPKSVGEGKNTTINVK